MAERRSPKPKVGGSIRAWHRELHALSDNSQDGLRTTLAQSVYRSLRIWYLDQLLLSLDSVSAFSNGAKVCTPLESNAASLDQSAESLLAIASREDEDTAMRTRLLAQKRRGLFSSTSLNAKRPTRYSISDNSGGLLGKNDTIHSLEKLSRLESLSGKEWPRANANWYFSGVCWNTSKITAQLEFDTGTTLLFLVSLIMINRKGCEFFS